MPLVGVAWKSTYAGIFNLIGLDRFFKVTCQHGVEVTTTSKTHVPSIFNDTRSLKRLISHSGIVPVKTDCLFPHGREPTLNLV